MERSLIGLLISVIIASDCAAAPVVPSKEDSLVYCEIAGLAYGGHRDITGSVAARIAEKAGLTPTDPDCGAIWREAYQIGKKVGFGGTPTEAEFRKWQRLQNFENKVFDGIIKSMAM
jgi:hypothetical protein